MKIFLAGATGAIGKRLVPLLVKAGHEVVASTRSGRKFEELRAQGAAPVAMDGLDRNAVFAAIEAARPEVIVHQMTSLASMRNLKHFDKEFALTNRLRTEGLQHLFEAGRSVGTKRIVTQSYSGWPNGSHGSRIKTEDDPLDANLPESMRQTLDGIRQLEQMVLQSQDIPAIALRYGSLYGPGTSTAQDGEIVKLVRARKFPIVGSGAGVWSFLHVDDAAQATRQAVESSATGVYNIVDDEPAEVSAWLPFLAQAVGAKPPRHIPAWLGRLAIGSAGVWMMTAISGSSNAKAKRDLGWRPAFATWREGFRRGL